LLVFGLLAENDCSPGSKAVMKTTARRAEGQALFLL